MATLVINPITNTKLEAVRKELPHALLLSGDPGVGLATIAKDLADDDLQSFIEPLDSKEQIDHTTGTISVDRIRLLYDQTRTKSTKRQVVIIDDADRMSNGAQAAFLKLLEEPNEGTHFILTSHAPRLLLPTIRSRVQSIVVDPATPSQTKSLLDAASISNATTRLQLEYLASGLPAELNRLINDKEYFDNRAKIMADTRVFLTGSTFEKMGIINAYHQDRTKTLQLLDSALAVTKKSLYAKPNPNLTDQLSSLLRAKEKIERNCNARLQLTLLVL